MTIPPVTGTPCASDGTLTVGANLATTCKFELMDTDAKRAAAKSKAIKTINQQAGRKYFEERWVKLKTPLTAGWTWNAGCDRHLVNWKRTGAPTNMGLWSKESVNCKTTKIMSNTVVPIPTGARTEDWYVRVVSTQPIAVPTQADVDNGVDWEKFRLTERKFGIWRNGELMTGEFMDPRQVGANQRTSNLVSEFHGEFITYPVFIDAKTIYYDVVPLPAK